ncbi:MAG TPA: glycoside hydrolase [Cyanobacteria bacterium UBA11049]|nr:glycoside hydrolase [Cyanobacteria bacterium UBA11049]
MVSFEQLQATVEYQCQTNLNLYDSALCDRLATQAAAGRHLRVLELPENQFAMVPRKTTFGIAVCLCEDDYPGWLLRSDIGGLKLANTTHTAIALSATEISNRLPDVIKFTQLAMQQANYYLWGGTVAPNYDCSGLIQAAFASVGVWLPRDAYQQEAFTDAIAIEELLPGDLVFFGTADKATHVGLYLGNGSYIHSSGKEIGRNGIGIDSLSNLEDEVSRSYYHQLRCCGRVVKSYQPQK